VRAGSDRKGRVGGDFARAKQEQPTCAGSHRCSNKREPRPARSRPQKDLPPAAAHWWAARISSCSCRQCQCTLAARVSLERVSPAARCSLFQRTLAVSAAPEGQVSPTRPPCSLAVPSGAGGWGQVLECNNDGQRALEASQSSRAAACLPPSGSLRRPCLLEKHTLLAAAPAPGRLSQFPVHLAAYVPL
jgi:hypothetical protein